MITVSRASQGPLAMENPAESCGSGVSSNFSMKIEIFFFRLPAAEPIGLFCLHERSSC